MAATYTAWAPGVTWSTGNKVMFQLFNGIGTGKIVKVFRVWVLNSQASAATTTVLQPFDMRKLTAVSSGGSPTTVSKLANDTNSTAAASGIICNYGNTTVGAGTVIRSWRYHTDEPAVGAFTVEELEAIVPLNVVWDLGYGESRVTPLTLNPGEGMAIYQAATASTAGNVDIGVEFTIT